MAAGVRGRALWVALAAGCKVSNPLFIDSGGSDASSTASVTDSASETTTSPEMTSTTDTTTTTTTTTDPEDTSTTSEVTSDTTSGVDTTSTSMPDPQLCGNGSLDAGEECDDGNVEPGDGCEPNCRELFDAHPISDAAPISAIVAGDFDGAGLPDLALTRIEPGGVQLLANDGAAGFTALMPIPTGDPVFGAAAGAIDGEEGSDLALVLDDSEFRVLVQQANGQFIPLNDFTASGDAPSLALVRGDADEHLDLIFTQFDLNQVEMRPGLGDGKFGAAVKVGLDGAVKHFAVGDLDGSPDPDLVATYSDGQLGVVQICPDFALKEPLPEPIMFGKSAAGVAIAELVLESPGPEIVVADPADGRVWMLSRADEASPYAPVLGVTVEGQPTEVLVLALRGGDGLDVVVLDGSGDVHVIATTEQGLAETVDTFAAVGNPAGWAAADFTGDARVDLAVASKTEGVVLLTNLSAE